MCTRVGSGMQEYDFTPAARLICDVDKVLWPFPDQRQDAGAESWIIIILCVCVCVCVYWGLKQHNLLPVFVVLF